MKSCAIMQPTYLPWSGFFNLMVSADVFVILDDAQLQRCSWHSRNQIVLAGVAQMLTVPVKRTGLATRICDAEINYASDWRRSHLGQLRQAYRRAPWGTLVIGLVEEVFDAKPVRLVELNLALIRRLAEVLRIETPLVVASELGIGGVRTSRLVELCRVTEATTYLSPSGAAEYLSTDGFSEQSGLELRFQEFVPEEYPQQGGIPFLPRMSVVDVIANVGPSDARGYVLEPSFPTFKVDVRKS